MNFSQVVPGQQARNVAASVTRRQAALLLGSLSVTGWPQAGPAAAVVPTTSSTCSTLDPTLAAAFMEAAYATVQKQQVVPAEQLQRERYKLQTQEYKYFVSANKDRVPALPDLSDNSGGLSNRTYFNFVSYILWKSVARHLPTPEQRTRFCAGVGEELLQQLAPDAAAALQAGAARQGGSSRQAPAAVVLSSMQQVLTMLQQRGFICSWQLVMGSQPGSWPGNWQESEPQLVGAEDLLQQQQPLEPGIVFQVKLQQPADIAASVALRSEEDGFWSRHVSSLLAALLHAGGYQDAAVDEYFSQDEWTGPQRASDKLLLLLGDPLQQVDVPWTPTTLVQDWSL